MGIVKLYLPHDNVDGGHNEIYPILRMDGAENLRSIKYIF